MDHSISSSIADYLRELSGARSAGTVRAYKNGLAHLTALLEKSSIDPAKTTPSQLSGEHALAFIKRLAAAQTLARDAKALRCRPKGLPRAP